MSPSAGCVLDGALLTSQRAPCFTEQVPAEPHHGLWEPQTLAIEQEENHLLCAVIFALLRLSDIPDFALPAALWSSGRSRRDPVGGICYPNHACLK